MKKELQNEDFLTTGGARRLCKCVRGYRKSNGRHYHCQYCDLPYRSTQSVLHHEKMVHNHSQNTSCSDSNTNCDASYCLNQSETTLNTTADVSMTSGLDSVTDVSMNGEIDSVTSDKLDSISDVIGGLDSITDSIKGVLSNIVVRSSDKNGVKYDSFVASVKGNFLFVFSLYCCYFILLFSLKLAPQICSRWIVK